MELKWLYQWNMSSFQRLHIYSCHQNFFQTADPQVKMEEGKKHQPQVSDKAKDMNVISFHSLCYKIVTMAIKTSHHKGQ